MSIKVEEQPFQLYFKSLTQKTYELNDNGTLTIEGIASTSNKDLQGDVILPECIESMKKQLTTSSKNLHGDHKYGLFDGIIGAIKEVIDSDEHTLRIKSIIRSKFAPEIKEMLEIGINLGFSIGGNVIDYNPVKEGWEIKDINLREISLTGMPANWDTYGSVTVSKGIVHANCLAGACHMIRRNFENEGENMSEQNNNGETAFTREDAVNLFNELMATKQEEIAKETLDKCEKEISRIVDEKVKEALENQNEGNDGNESGNGEELKTLINDTVKSAIDNSIGNLFKDLGNNRNPEFQFDQHKNLDNGNDETDEGNGALTSKQIAEDMFKNQSKADFIASLLG